MSYLNDQGVDHQCLLYYDSIKPHCAICMASYCEMKYREKAVRGYSLKSSSHMIKRHFDMRLVFHRPNKCTESQYVFSREI